MLEVRNFPNIGSGRRLLTIKPGKRERNASFTVLPTSGLIFWPLFGTESFVTGTPNVHTLTSDNKGTLPTGATTVTKLPTLPSISLGVYYDGSPTFLRSFLGTVYDGATISCAEGEELKMELDVTAQGITDQTTPTPTALSQPTTDKVTGAAPTPYMFYDRGTNATQIAATTGTRGGVTSPPAGEVIVGATYSQAGNTVSGGGVWARVSSFSFTYRNAVNKRYFFQTSNAQNPFAFYPTKPTYDLTVDLVPAGKLSGDTDSVYDLLDTETKADIVVPFAKGNSTSDRLDFVFLNCLFKEAAHSAPEDQGEVRVTCQAVPTEVLVVARDNATAYNGLT